MEPVRRLTTALGLGLANGDLFPRTIANSPGGIVSSDTPPTGHTEFFFSHGVQDPVLSIDFASRRIVPQLQQEGYTVTFVEFPGGHLVPPPDIALAAVTWFLR